MSEYRKEQARKLRRWAGMLRDRAERQEGYQKSLMHTIEIRPDGRRQERYCAYGLAEAAAQPAERPHDEIWEQSGARDGGRTLVFTPGRGTSEHYPAPETLEELGIYPDWNPFAMKELANGEDPDGSGREAPDLVYLPAARLSRREEVLERGKGIESLDGVTYVHLSSVSDAGLEHWPDIAAFAEMRAAELEAED